jgi:hypothetical protein
MKIAAFALAAAVTSVSSAAFVEYYTVKTQTTNSGIDLDVYVLFARFSGSTDTIVNAFNFNRVDGTATNLFYHKDLSTGTTAPYPLTKAAGTWNPGQTGSVTANRPFDSWLTIGGSTGAGNSTNADPSWPAAGGSWNRPDVPNGVNAGWFNSNPPNLQGRVGASFTNGTNTVTTASDSVRLGQFVVDRNANGGTWNLKIGYTDGVSTTVLFAETTFSLPTPGAVALLGLAGLVGRRRRR